MCHVLVIEDCKDDYFLVARQLNSKPTTTKKVSWASSIEDLRLLKNELQPDVILLDVNLPGTTGLGGLRAVEELFAVTPIILHTGVSDESFAQEALRSGAEDFVIKGSPAPMLKRAVSFALERSKWRQRLKEAHKKAQAANVAKSRFLANMSHEIRSPLTAVLGYLDIIESGPLSNTQASSLQAIRRNGVHLLQVINDILDLSKIEEDKFTINKEIIDLPSFCFELESDFKMKAEQKGLCFELRCESPVPNSIFSDSQLLRQILINLISNAVKFTDEGWVKLKVAYDKGNDKLIFQVEDSGIGISEKQIKHLFQAFTQADSSTTREYGGTGLGLAISQRLADLLGGSININSELGVGSRFHLCLDGVITEEAHFIDSFDKFENATIAEQRPEDISLSGTVLVVDDLNDNRELMRFYLEKLGLVVIDAVDGKDCIDKVMRYRPQLVLMDMQMPLMDGYMCTKELRRFGVDIPIIAVTANALSDSEKECLDAGCTTYISKPYNEEQLKKIIKHYLVIGSNPRANRKYSEKEQQIINRFVSNLEGRVSSLETCLIEKKWEELKVHTHKLAGAGLFGFEKLGETAKKLELVLIAGESEKATDLVADIKNQHKTILSERG